MTYGHLIEEIRSSVGDTSADPFATPEEILRYLAEGQALILARRFELGFINGEKTAVVPAEDTDFLYDNRVAVLLRLYVSAQILGKIGGRRSDPKQSANLLQQFYATLGV
jgi:hypothetical protein